MRLWIISCLLLCAAVAHAAAPTNRADEYRRAYRELQAGTSKDLTPLLKDWMTAPLNVDRFALLAAAEPALAIAVEATFLPHCDWKLRPGDLNADTSHREAVRALVALLGIRARHGLRETKRTDLAIQDAVSAIAMARDLSRDGTLASTLVGRQLESQLLTMMSEQTARLSPQERQHLAHDYAALEPDVTLGEALLAHERSMRLGLTQATRGASSRKQLAGRLEQFPMLKPVASVLADGCGPGDAGFARCLEQLRVHYATWAKWFAIPPDEFARAYEKDVAGLAGNPVFRFVTPSIPAVQQAEYSYQQHRKGFADLLADGAPALPVVEAGRLVGIVTLHLMHSMALLSESRKIRRSG